jgi:RHS repeat-associated protein
VTQRVPLSVITLRKTLIPIAYACRFAESGSQETHHFTTYERDEEAAIDYAVNRMYSYAVGRFKQLDRSVGSLAYPQGLNRYSYVRNHPADSIDPTGLVPVCNLIGVEHISYLVDDGNGETSHWEEGVVETYACEDIDVGGVDTPWARRPESEPFFGRKLSHLSNQIQ